jgi:hypothetical protein
MTMQNLPIKIQHTLDCKKSVLSVIFHFALSFFILLFPFFIPHHVSAASLLALSDVISDSRLSGTSTTHVITFTTVNAIPANGSIIIVPEATGASSFTIPALLDVNDIDLAVAVVPGIFVDHSLAALPNATDDGVSVVSGASGSITFILSSGSGIPAGATVQLEIGSNATFSATGTRFIVSPSLENSYRIRVYTRDSANATLDGGAAMIAIIPSVTTLAASGNINPPVRSNGLPTGLLPGSTANVLVSLNTDIPAMCKYATSSGVSFYTMSSSTIFTEANLGLLHFQSLAVATNTINNLYVRCLSDSFIFNPDDFLITFDIGVVPNASTTPTPPAPPPPPPLASGSSGGGGGGGGLYLQTGAVTLGGRSFPSGRLSITQDGVVVKEEVLSVLGDFNLLVDQLQRGTYNWGVFALDPDGKKSATYVSTIYLVARTNNIIAPIYLSPTMSVESSSVAIGGNVILRGYALPLLPVQVIMSKQGDPLNSKIITGTTTANGNGSWTLALSTAGLKKATYEIKSQTLLSAKEHSLLSPIVYVGVGQSASPDFGNRADLNKDKKVNLIDFSILLFNWKGSDDVADINQDGTVNLTDFSIMLSAWTG